jgi:hypothetical protein
LDPRRDKTHVVRTGIFGIALGVFPIVVSIYGFLTDHAEKLSGSRTWVWVSRADDPSLYWLSNTTYLIMGALIVAGSSMIILKAVRDQSAVRLHVARTPLSRGPVRH